MFFSVSNVSLTALERPQTAQHGAFEIYGRAPQFQAYKAGGKWLFMLPLHKAKVFQNGWL